MSKSHHPQRLAIRLLAMRLERDVLCVEEKAMLASALRVMADGGKFDAELGMARPQGSPKNDRALAAVEYVALLMLKPSDKPYGDLGEGLKKAEAIERAAREFNVAQSTLEKKYQTPEGKKARLQANEMARGWEGLIQAPID